MRYTSGPAFHCTRRNGSRSSGWPSHPRTRTSGCASRCFTSGFGSASHRLRSPAATFFQSSRSISESDQTRFTRESIRAGGSVSISFTSMAASVLRTARAESVLEKRECMTVPTML